MEGGGLEHQVLLITKNARDLVKAIDLAKNDAAKTI